MLVQRRCKRPSTQAQVGAGASQLPSRSGFTQIHSQAGAQGRSLWPAGPASAAGNRTVPLTGVSGHQDRQKRGCSLITALLETV